MASKAAENALRTLFRRCVQCPEQVPSCPICPQGQVCSQTVISCDACPKTSCVKSSLSGATTTNQSANRSSGPNVGAIAGGVVGGVIFIALATYLVWRFCLKRRRQALADEWAEDAHMDEKGGADNDFTMRRDARSSTHTVTSMASTVLTRASNIIQIAYIPGVTNRSGAASPGFAVPPVPPIPIPTTAPGGSQPYTDNPDQHFFVPGDLRDSTYSGLSSTTDGGRSSYAHRQSLTPSLARTSLASTVYRNNAVLDPMPAQTIVRGKAAVVSVKSSSASSPAETPGTETPPPIPSLSNSGSLTGSGRARFVGTARPVPVRVPSSNDGLGQSPVGSVRSTATVGRPMPLNIVRKGGKTGMSVGVTPESSRPPTATTGSASQESEQQAQGLGLLLRPLTEVSMRESVGSEGTHARARRSATHAALSPGTEDESDDDDVEDADEAERHERSRRSLLGDQHPGAQTLVSPFTDSAPSSPDAARRSQAGLATVIEEAARRARRESVHGGLGSVNLEARTSRERDRDSSPFGDGYAL